MKCQKIKRFLPLFLDGQLKERRALQIKAHIEVCPACSQELKLFEQSWDLLNKWERIVPSPNFKANFWQKVTQEEERALSRVPVFVFLRLIPALRPVLAVCAVILIIGIYLANLSFNPSLLRMVTLTKNEDIQMLKELDVLEEFDVIHNMQALEDFEAINSIELT